MESALLIAILIAATLPLVASILSAFSSRTRVVDTEDYFLFDRSLDIDSFLKTTIGYSLQVASIALFFYWSFNFGLLGSLVDVLRGRADICFWPRSSAMGSSTIFWEQRA